MKNPRSKYEYAVRRVVDERDARVNQPVILGSPAFLGDASGNITTYFGAALQDGQVVVRDMSGNLSVAYNQRVPLRAGLPIMVGYDPLAPKIFQVLGQRDWWSVQTAQSLIFHHERHEFPNEDTTWMKGEQFLPWMAVPSGITVVIYPAATYTDTGWVLGESVAVSMTGHVPSYGARICLITVDNSGEYVVTEGAIVSSVTISITDCPAVPVGHQPLWAAKLTAGQTSIEGVDSTTGRWSYLYDLRWGFSKTQLNVMLTDVYDPDEDGSVLEADHALAADVADVAITADAVRGQSIDPDLTPVDGHVLVWNTATEQYEDGAMSGGEGGGGSPHLHGIARWSAAAGDDTFDLPDIPEYVDAVYINGVRLDDMLDYSQSADRTQIILAEALPEASIVSAEYAVAVI